MPTLNDIISLIPVFISSFIGSWIQDFVITFSSHGKGHRFFTRTGMVLIGATLSTFLIGLGGSILLPATDWRIMCLASFVMGFLGFRLAVIFSKSFLGLELIGLGSIANSTKLSQMQIEEEERRNEGRPETKDGQ